MGGMNSASLNDLIPSLGLLWIMVLNNQWCAPLLGSKRKQAMRDVAQPFFSITCSTQTFTGKLSLCWPPCSEVTRPSAVHGGRTSCSREGQLSASSLSAGFLWMLQCSFSLFLSPSRAPELQFQGRAQQLCYFPPVYLILTYFSAWLGFKNNTESTYLERTASYRCAFCLSLDYRTGKAPALLVLKLSFSIVLFPTLSLVPAGSPCCPQSSLCHGPNIASSSRAAPAEEVKSSFQPSPSLFLHSSQMAEFLS